MTDSAPPANDAAVPATQEAADAPPPDAALPAGEDDDDGAANGDATAGEVEATPDEAPDSAAADATEVAAAAAPAPADGSVPPPPGGAPPAASAGEGLGNPTATAAPAGAAPDEDILAPQLDSEFARTGSKDGVARRKSVKERLQGAVTSARSLGATGRRHVTSLAHLLTLTLRGKSAPGALSKEGQESSKGGADGDGKGNGGKKKKKKAKKKGAGDDEQEFDPYAEDEESETEEQKKIRKRRERAEQKARELDASKSPEEKGMDEHLRKLQARKKKVKKEIQKLGLAKGPMPNDRDFLRTAEFMERRLFREDELETLAEAHEDIPSTPEETEDQKTERLKRKKLAKMKQGNRGGYPAPKERLKYKHKVLQPLSMQMKREIYHDFKLENLWDDEIFIDENLDEAKTKILLDLGFATEDLYDEETGDPIEYSRKELKEMVRQRNIELQYRLGEPPARKWRTDTRFLGERGSLAKSLTPGGMMTDEDYEREDDEIYERYSDGYAMWVEQQRWDAYYEALAGALEEMLQVELALYDQKRGAIGSRKIVEKRLKTSLSPRSRLKLKDRLHADDENAFPMPDDSRQKELAQRRKEARDSGMRGNDRPPPPPPLPRRDFYQKTGAEAVVNEVATPKSEADMSDAEVEIRNDIAQELEDYLLANADCYDEFDSPMLEKIANFGYYDMKEDPQSTTNRMARRQQKVKSGFGLGSASVGGGVKSMPSPMRGLARTLSSSLFKEEPHQEEGSPPESDEQGMNTRGRKSMNLVAYTGAKGGKVDRAGAFSQVDEMESSKGTKSKGRKKDDDSDEDEGEDAKGGGKKKKSKRSKSAEDALRAMEGRHAAPPPDWERSPYHNFRREGNHYQEKNEEDEDEVDNEADQDAAIQEAFLVSQAEVSGEENESGSAASGSQTMNKSRSVVHKTSSGGLAVIQEEDQDGEAGGGPQAIDENETGGPGQMRRGPPRPDGSFEDGTRSMLEQSSSVLGASGEFDPSLVIGPDGRPVDPQPGSKIVRGATGTDEPTANPLEQSQQQQQRRVNADGFLIDSNDNLVRGEDGQPVRPVYPGDIYAEDYDGAGTGRVDGGYEQASSSSGSLGDPQEVRLKWSPPLPENPDAEYRLPKPPLALSVDLDGAIKKIKMTKELHAQALEKEEKYGTKKINRHAPNAKRFLQYEHEIGQIVRKMKYKLQEGRVKQYKKKLQMDPPPKTNVRDPSSWVKIFHFDTMTTSYWRYEAYNFVLHAMDASVDVIPVNKRNFEVFQAKVAAGEKRKREEEAEEAEEERQRQAERAPKLRRRISFNEDVEQADRDIFEGEHDRSPDGDADYGGRDFFANAFRHPNAEALGFQEDDDGDYFHEDGREDDFDTDDEDDGRRRRPRDEDYIRGFQLQRPPDPHAAARSSCSSSSSAPNRNRRRQPVHYEGSHRTADVSPPSAPLPPPIPHSASPPALPFGNSAASSVAAGSSGSGGSSGQPSFGRKKSVDTMFGASGKLKRIISNEDEGKTKDEAFAAKMARSNSGLRGVSPESVQRMSSYARLRSFGSSASLSSSGRGSLAGQEPNLKGILKQTMSRRVLPGGQLRKFAVDLPFTEALWGEENVRFGGSFSPEKDKKLLVHEREEKTSSWGGKSKATERKRFDYKAKMKRALLKIKLLRGMGSSDATARQREEEQRQMMVLPKALVAEKFLDEKKALTDAQTLEDRRETANVIRHEIEAKITAGMASRRPKRRSSFHVLDPFTGLPLIETDGDVTEVEVEKLKREKKAAEEEKKGKSVGGQHTGFTRPPDEHEGYYTDSEQEVEVRSPDPSVKQRLVRRREGHIRPGSREAVEKEMETLSDDEEAVDMPAHKRLLTVNQLKGTAQYYAQMKKAEEEQAVNVYDKVTKRREVKDGVKLASNAVVVPGADSQSEDELERKKRIMSRKSRRKFKKVRASLRERMKERQLQSNENMMETMCAFVEISGETREVMLRQLLGHRKILPGEASRAKPSCCFISYRFFSLLEVISSLEVSARMTEERYLELFCGMTDGVSVQRNLQIGSVAVTSRIREILDLAGHDPKPPVTSSLSTKLDTGNWDNGDRLARYREFNPFEERIVLDEWDNLKLEVVPAGEGVERKLTKLAVKEKRLLQQQDEHYVYVPKEANEKVRLDFLVELTKVARDSWGEARRKFEHVRAYIDQQVPKVRRDLEKPIIVDVFDAVRDEIERTVQQDRLIDLERLEMEREFHKMRMARRKRQDEERKEERRRKREAKKLAKRGHGQLHEAAKGKYGNPYSNVDPDPDINFDKGVIGGKSWEEAQRLAGRRVSDALLSGTDASSLMRTLETVPGVNYDDPRRRESVLQNKTLEELEDEYEEQKDDLSPMARRQKQHIISLTRMRRFLVGAFYTNSFFQPGNSIGYFLTYQADGAGSQVIFDRRRAAEFVSLYLEVDAPSQTLEYFSNYQDTLEKMLQDKSGKIVQTANSAFDRILRQLTLAKELIAAADVLGIPDPEQEVKRLRQERKLRREEEDEYQETRRAAGPGDDTPFEEEVEEEEEDSPDEEEESTDLDSTEDDGDEEEEEKDFDLSILLPPIHPQSELNEKSLRREEVERKLSEKPRGKMILNPATNKEILAAPRGMKKRQQKAMVLMRESQRRAQDRAAITIPEMLDSPEVQSSRPGSPERTLEFSQIAETADLAIPVDPVLLKRERRAREREQIERDALKKSKKGTKKDLAKMIGTGEVSHDGVGASRSQMSRSRGHGEEEEDVDDLDFDFSNDDLDFSKMQKSRNSPKKGVAADGGRGGSVVPFRRDDNDDDDEYGEEEEFGSLFDDESGKEGPLEEIVEAADSSSCASDYPGERQELDYQATIGEETRTLVAQEALRDSKNGGAILAQDIQALLALAKLRQRTSKLLDVNLKKLQVPSAARKLAIFEHWNPNLDPNPRSLLGLVAFHYFSPPKFYQTALEAKKEDTLVVHPLSAHLEEIAEQKNKGPPRLVSNGSSASSAPVPLVSPEKHNKNSSSTNTDEMLGTGSSLSAVVQLYGAPAGHGTADHENQPDNEQRPPLLETDEARSCNRYLYDVAKSQDPFAKVFQDIVEDLCVKMMRFEHRHVGFELVAQGFPTNLDFASGSRTDQADMICLLAICKLATVFAATGR